MGGCLLQAATNARSALNLTTLMVTPVQPVFVASRRSVRCATTRASSVANATSAGTKSMRSLRYTRGHFMGDAGHQFSEVHTPALLLPLVQSLDSLIIST